VPPGLQPIEVRRRTPRHGTEPSSCLEPGAEAPEARSALPIPTAPLVPLADPAQKHRAPKRAQPKCGRGRHGSDARAGDAAGAVRPACARGSPRAAQGSAGWPVTAAGSPASAAGGAGAPGSASAAVAARRTRSRPGVSRNAGCSAPVISPIRVTDCVPRPMCPRRADRWRARSWPAASPARAARRSVTSGAALRVRRSSRLPAWRSHRWAARASRSRGWTSSSTGNRPRLCRFTITRASGPSRAGHPAARSATSRLSMPSANGATRTPAQRATVILTEPGPDIGQRNPPTGKRHLATCGERLS